MIMCPHCGTKLSVFELDLSDDFVYPDICPFCGCSRSAFAEGSYQVLRQVIERYDNEILLNRKALSGLVGDLLNPKEQKTFKFAIAEGVGEIFFNMIGKDDNYINVQKHKATLFLTEDIGMSEERAEYVVKAFMYALGFETEISIAHKEDKNFCDRDNGYFALAEDFYKDGEEEIAEQLYYISSNSGNIKAMRKTISLVKENNWMPSDEEWFNWNKAIADCEEDNIESSYIIAMLMVFWWKKILFWQISIGKRAKNLMI